MFSTLTRQLSKNSNFVQQCRQLSVSSTNFVRSPKMVSTNSHSPFATFHEQQEIQVDSRSEEMTETKRISHTLVLQKFRQIDYFCNFGSSLDA